MSYNYYNNNLEKRMFSAFKSNDDEKTSWKLNENLLNHIDPGQAINQRQSTSYLVNPGIKIDTWWNDTEYGYHQQRPQSASTLSNISIYSDDISNNTDQECPRKFTNAPPGLFPSSSTSSLIKPIVLQDTTTMRSPTCLSDYNQKLNETLKSRNVNQQQSVNCCFKSSYKLEKSKNSNDFFYEESKKPTWSEVISKKTNENDKRKPPINSHLIHQLLKTKENTKANTLDEDFLSSMASLKMPTGPKYITDSVYLMSSINNNTDFNNTSIERPYTVVRIPWGLNIDSVKRVFQSCKFTELPSGVELPQAIHILMDVKTGKTTGIAYVEAKFLQHSSKEDLSYIISRFKLLCTQSRRVMFELSSYDQLCNDIFPSWKGKFRNGKATPYNNPTDDTSTNKNSFFIDQKDLQSLLNICRHYKVHYNRRCPERPFEYLISIIMNIPWKQAKIITTIQRDIIYECYKLVTEALRIHTSKPLHSFDSDLLDRLVRAAILCDGFTIKQKSIILKHAQVFSGLTCPPELEIYLQEPPLVNDRELTSFLT